MSDVCFRLGGMTEDRKKKVHLVNNLKNGRIESGTVVFPCGESCLFMIAHIATEPAENRKRGVVLVIRI